ncbi:MAG TPA: hypothetical protein VM715_14935 [Candidatus Acidoferrum sp.]|nr:hypothetical protein [Candidatus Acidoferrum sp.]
MSDIKSKLMEEVNVGGSLVEDHKYEPRDKDQPWGLCHCGLAEASHKASLAHYRPTAKRAAKEAPNKKSTPRKKVRRVSKNGSKPSK